MFPRLQTWWNRRCGAKEVLMIALPLIISTSSWSIMHFIDRLFLAWYSQDALAACMPAGMTHYTIFCFPLGISSYCVTFVAQYWGAKRPDKIGKFVWQGLYIGLIFLPIIWLTGLIAPWFFLFINHPAVVAAQEAAYYQSLCTCGGACVMLGALCGFFSGRGQTWIVMIIDTFGAILNILLDMVLIFGSDKIAGWPLATIPELGIVGAGLATSIAIWVKLVIYFIIFFLPSNCKRFQTWTGRAFDWQAMKRLLFFGAPNGLQFVIESGAFTVLLLLVGMLGSVEIAATNLAFNVNALAFIPITGLGMGLTALVGQQQGAKRPNLSVRATHTALQFAVLYLLFFAAIYIINPNVFLIAHQLGNAQGFEQTRVMTIYLLKFMAVFMIFDGTNVIFSSVLKGAGDTLFVLRLAGLLSPIPVFVTYMGLRFFGMGITFCWTVMTLWVFSMSLCFYLRYLGGKWKSMQVIEHSIIALQEESQIINSIKG